MKTVITLKIEVENRGGERHPEQNNEEWIRTQALACIREMGATRGIRVNEIADLSPVETVIFDGMGHPYNLSKELYRVNLPCIGKMTYKKDVHRTEVPENERRGNLDGCLVRMISGTRPIGADAERSEIPGFHFDPDYATVCPIWAKKAQWHGFKREYLKEVTL